MPGETNLKMKAMSRDYSYEERKEFAVLKSVQETLKRKLGIISKIIGSKIEIYQKKYSIIEAEKYANELLSKKGMEVISSPKEMVNGNKRSKLPQKQKEGRKKLRNQGGNSKNKEEQGSPQQSSFDTPPQMA